MRGRLLQRYVVEDDRGTVDSARKSWFDIAEVRDLFCPRLRVAERFDNEDGDRRASSERASVKTPREL